MRLRSRRSSSTSSRPMRTVTRSGFGSGSSGGRGEQVADVGRCRQFADLDGRLDERAALHRLPEQLDGARDDAVGRFVVELDQTILVPAPLPYADDEHTATAELHELDAVQ